MRSGALKSISKQLRGFQELQQMLQSEWRQMHLRGRPHHQGREQHADLEMEAARARDHRREAHVGVRKAHRVSSTMRKVIAPDVASCEVNRHRGEALFAEQSARRPAPLHCRPQCSQVLAPLRLALRCRAGALR
eukprot:6740674-Pyramimonas_sp.AAC.1